jgi:hypothetical protein
MFISVDKDGKLTLCEPHDFKRLHIETAEMTPEDINGALGSVAIGDGENFWVGVEALKALSPCADDPVWQRSFDAMITSVEKFGWVSPDRARVRCHLQSK